MKKPKVVTKTYLRDNLAEITNFVVNDTTREVWIADTGEIKTVLVDADHYTSLQTEIETLKNTIFELEALQSIQEFKANSFKTANSTDELFEDLDSEDDN